MNRYLAKRVPIVYRSQVLMPMRWGRAWKYVKLGKARFRLNRKLGIKYLELLVKPRKMEVDLVVLSLDPGSTYDGWTVASTECHHENFELIHNIPFSGQKIKGRMLKRKMYRKIRRGRLRNRPARFDSRTRAKLPPTLQSMLDYRLWFIDQICQLYPISQVVYERPVFDTWHKKFQGYATLVMQGLKKLVKTIESKGIEVIEKRGYDTSERRIEIFGEDRKSKDKSEKSFYAHCLDSYSLATITLDSIPVINKKVRLISKNGYHRRELHRWKARNSTRWKNNVGLKFYKKIHKGGMVEILDPWYGGKNQKVKIRLQAYPKGFSKTAVKYVPRNPKYKQFRSNYGGTVYKGVSKYGRYRNIETGEIILTNRSWSCKRVSRDKDKYELLAYQNRNIEVVK